MIPMAMDPLILKQSLIGWGITAAKRDLVDGVSVDYDFTGTIMNAYLEGRT